MKKSEIKKLLDPKFHHWMSAALETFHGLFDCPNCHLPTFWPYGEDPDDLRQVHRWMCKQCGLYVGPEGEAQALYDPVVDLTDTPLAVRGCWQLTKDASEWAYLPRDFIAGYNRQCCEEADGV